MLSKREVDSGYAWVVAIASCWVNFSIYGLWRSFGVLFVAFMHDFGVNHQTASWPFTLCCAVYHLIGPIVGLLSHYYTLRTLQAIGCIVAAAGVLLSYFASEFIMIVIFLGAVQGIGLGVIRTLSLVVIQQYFNKNRTTATGIAMAGGAFSSFFFPAFTEHLLKTYGLQISFLIFGVIILQALIGISFQCPPNHSLISMNYDNKSDDGNEVMEKEKVNKKIVEDGELNNNSPLRIIKDVNEETTLDDCTQCSEEEILCNKCAYIGVLNRNQEERSHSHECVLSVANKKSKKLGDAKEKRIAAFRNMKIVLSKPIFFVICYTFVVYNICLQVYLMTIVDLTTEKQIAEESTAVMLITIFSIGDLIGRVSFGWISDKGFSKPKNINIFCQCLLSVLLIFTPNMTSILALQLCSTLVGIMIGIITVLWPVLNVDYVGTERLAISLGFNCFFSGAESLVRPFVIGFFLDYLKSYNLLFYTIASLVAITVVLWLLEPIMKKHE